MTVFYFIRHGQADFTEANTKIYQGQGYNMLTLSPLGRKQIEAAARDHRLKDAELILSSPFGRTLHSAAILSKKLGLDICVETGLHEWLADGETYEFLPQDEADRRYQELSANRGIHPDGEKCAWESAEQMRCRVMDALEKYKRFHCVIVCCHGTVMEYVLGIPHPSNGQIVKYEC